MMLFSLSERTCPSKEISPAGDSSGPAVMSQDLQWRPRDRDVLPRQALRWATRPRPALIHRGSFPTTRLGSSPSSGSFVELGHWSGELWWSSNRLTEAGPSGMVSLGNQPSLPWNCRSPGFGPSFSGIQPHEKDAPMTLMGFLPGDPVGCRNKPTWSMDGTWRTGMAMSKLERGWDSKHICRAGLQCASLGMCDAPVP